MIDTANKFQVGSFGGNRLIILGIPPVFGMTPDDALNLAAWLVAIAEPMGNRKFAEVLEAVKST